MAKLTKRHVRRQGRRDGRHWRWDLFASGSFFRRVKEPYPSSEAEDPPVYEIELKEIAEGQMKALDVDWSREDKRLKPAFCEALSEYLQATQAAQKEAAEAEIASERLEAARERLEDRGMPDLDRRWMLFWLILIGAAEYPLNSMVFELFGERYVLTHVFALGIAFLIPVLAHLFGSNLRKEDRTAVDRWLLVVSPAFVLALLAAVSFLRAQFLEAGEVAELLGISITLTQSTVLFLIFNLAFFFAAIFVSYEGTHPQHRLYRQELHLYETLKKIAGRESAESDEAQRRREAGWRALDRARARRRARYRHFRRQAEEIAELLETAVWVYRRANLEAREDGGEPPAFSAEPRAAQVPAGLVAELPDEDCASAETAGRP